ncbi:MAG TPA: xylulokinase [Acidobacteriota bacterium]|nr:xylulokinase [Acidobacteriota bacterium]
MSLALGIDVSTTATKALLLSEKGEVVSVASSSYELSTPRPLWAEQDPRLWWEAACQAVKRALQEAGAAADSVCGVGLTGQMHGLVLLDESGEVLRPAILWNDQRASAQCDEIRRRLGLRKLVEITGNDAFPGFTLPKLMWVRRHEPEIYSRLRRVLLPKDYLRYKLTGGFATDKAGAGGTLMLDLRSRDWSPELLQAFDVPSSWLPPTHEGTEVTGEISASGSRFTGLAVGTPVVGGGGDQAAGAVGTGACKPGVVSLTLGTSGVVFASSERPLTDDKGALHAFPHALPGTWHVMGVMLSAAGSLRWHRDVAAAGMDFAELVQEAADIAPGCDGLLFLPYLSGERTPHADPKARGAFLGLTLSHQRAHMTRAVLEGVAFALADNLALMQRVGISGVRQIRLAGGGAQSPVWRQILADVLDTELVAVEAPEGAALGAAMLAGIATGLWPDIEQATQAAVNLGQPIRPRPDSAEAYRPHYDRFREAYRSLRPLFEL